MGPSSGFYRPAFGRTAQHSLKAAQVSMGKIAGGDSSRPMAGIGAFQRGIPVAVAMDPVGCGSSHFGNTRSLAKADTGIILWFIKHTSFRRAGAHQLN